MNHREALRKTLRSLPNQKSLYSFELETKEKLFSSIMTLKEIQKLCEHKSSLSGRALLGNGEFFCRDCEYYE